MTDDTTAAPQTTVEEVLSSALRDAIDRACRHLPEIAKDDDPEHVHQTRVGFRRARAITHAFRGTLRRKWRRALGAEIKALSSGLGPLRDADIVLARTRAHAATLSDDEQEAARGLLEELAVQRDQIRSKVVARIRDEDREARIVALQATMQHARLRKGATEGDVLKVASTVSHKLERAVTRLGADVTPNDLHRVRILTKRARYAIAAIEPPLGPTARSYVAAAAELQTVLGEMHDASVSAVRIEDMGTADSGRRLVELERAAIDAALAAWPEAWAALRTKATALP